jgi:hypothetical protein
MSRIEIQYKVLPAVPNDAPAAAREVAGPPGQEQADPNKPQPFSGDVYDEGDETDPANAYAHLKGEDGTEGWLDHDDDGTVTGWVRTPDGTVYRYTDPQSWAIDVDDAGLRRDGGESAPADGEEIPEGGEADTDGGEPVDEQGDEPEQEADAQVADDDSAMREDGEPAEVTDDGAEGDTDLSADDEVDEESDHMDNRHKRFKFEGKAYELRYETKGPARG